MRTVTLIFSFIFVVCHTFANNTEVDSLISELDKTISESAKYVDIKYQKINNLKDLISTTASPNTQFEISRALYNMYLTFNTDSANVYARKMLNLSLELRDIVKINEAKICLVEIFTSSGLYNEAIKCFDEIQIENTPQVKSKYYFVARTLYGDLANFSNSTFEKKAYEEKIDYYRDLLITSLPDSSFLYKLAYSDKLNRYGKFDESLKITLPFYSTLPDNSHERAMIAFNIAKAYVGKNDTTSQLKWFLLSSINDLRTSTKLYVSLKHISLILFAWGDIDRSYAYIRKALEDATSCNAKLRAIEIAQFLPIIDKANLKIQNEHRINNLIMMLLISLFAFVLVVVIFVVYRQKNKLAKAREELSESNNQLQELNHELYLINVELKGTNSNLIESNHIKEEYIGKYMELCSVYINKMEDYRRNLNKLAIKGKTDTLIEEIKSKDFIDKEFKEFAMSFDQTFLYLFPTFVEDFNALLSKPEEINPKGGMHLSTELRIYALIRLGINDSVKISHFLGCSMSTIYNYKTRIRFKALGNRDELESEVMKIGLH